MGKGIVIKLLTLIYLVFCTNKNSVRWLWIDINDCEQEPNCRADDLLMNGASQPKPPRASTAGDPKNMALLNTFPDRIDKHLLRVEKMVDGGETALLCQVVSLGEGIFLRDLHEDRFDPRQTKKYGS